MDPAPVAAENVPRLVPPERLRRPEAEQRMDAELLARSPEVADGAECVGHDESAKLRDPGRDLLPETRARERDDLERRGRDSLHRNGVVGDAQRRGDIRAVARVAVEQLDDARGLAELRDSLDCGRPQDGIEDPDLTAALERVGAAPDPLLRDPAEAVLELVAELEALRIGGCRDPVQDAFRVAAAVGVEVRGGGLPVRT